MKIDFKDSSHGGHLGFPIGTILTILIYKSPWCFLPRPKSIGRLVQEKKRKINFQDGGHGGHLGFPIGTILAILLLIYQSPWCFLPSFESIGHLVQKKQKIDCKDCGHLGFPIRKILAVSDIQITRMLSTKFQVNWSFGSGEEAKIRFSRWRLWRPCWISDRKDFGYFWPTSHPVASYQVSSRLVFRFMRRSENHVFEIAASAAIANLCSKQFYLFLI